jgi:transposase
MPAYSTDLCERVAAARESGSPLAAVATRFGVSISFVHKLAQWQRTRGNVRAALPHRGGPAPLLTAAARQQLVACLRQQPDATRDELRVWVAALGGPAMRRATLGRAVQRLDWRRKKKHLHAAERDTERVRHQRAAFVEAVQGQDVTRFPFVDETSTKLTYGRRYGRAPGGQRVNPAVPLPSGPNVTLLAALPPRGRGAAMSGSGAVNGAVFAAYVDQVLGPTLRPGDGVVRDNLPAHNVDGLAALVEKRGARRLYLPPYSPDFNPIALAFSKLKTKLRQLQARTREALEKAIRAAVKWIRRQDARNWFAHCGLPTVATRYIDLRTALRIKSYGQSYS